MTLLALTAGCEDTPKRTTTTPPEAAVPNRPKVPGNFRLTFRDRPERKPNHARKMPFVSHVRGTVLVVEHIERHWCPSILRADLTHVVPGSSGPNRLLGRVRDNV